MTIIPCPFVYSDGRRCEGHIERIEAYKADLIWSNEGPGWAFGFAPRSHYHLFCSKKGNHAGPRRQDNPQMKRHLRELPSTLRELIEATNPQASVSQS